MLEEEDYSLGVATREVMSPDMDQMIFAGVRIFIFTLRILENPFLEWHWVPIPMLRIHPPKTNMEPENGPLEKEISIGNHHFQVPCSISGVYLRIVLDSAVRIAGAQFHAYHQSGASTHEKSGKHRWHCGEGKSGVSGIRVDSKVKKTSKAQIYV